METIFDDIEKESVESFEFTDELEKINIISYDDLRDKIEYQFNPLVECPIDSNDYIKWFCINILKVDKNEFPNIGEFINQDNEEDYENFMNLIEYYIKQRFGITFNDDDEKRFENVYNIYYFLVVKPEILLVDYLLDYHFYKEGYDFKEIYEKNKLFNVPLAGDLNVDPIDLISGVKQQYAVQKTENRDLNRITYKDRFDYFLKYAKVIFLDESEFKFYNLFEKVNEFAPCDNYENLDDQINIFYNIKYEREDLITDWFIDIVLNPIKETYINQKIIDQFFKQIKDFEYSVNKGVIG